MREPPSTVRSRIGANLSRMEPPRRLPGVDMARGLAVVGMFAAHLIVIIPLEWENGDTWTGIVSGRSSILFATLAGVSLALVSEPAAARSHGEPARRWGARTQIVLRAGLIWALGVVLDDLGVPIYVILPAYGILFLIAVPLLRLPTAGLFALATVIALTMPFVVAAINHLVTARADAEDIDGSLRLLGWNYPFLLWAAFITAGIGAGRLLVESAHRAWWLLLTGAVLAWLGYGLIGPTGNTAEAQYADAAIWSGEWMLQVLQDHPHSSGVGEAIGSGGFALGTIGVCVLLGTTGLRWLLFPVRAVGAMPLTAYAAHVLVWAIWIAIEEPQNPGFDPWVQFHALDPFWPTTIWVLVGCTLWTLLIGKGPLEALLGTLTRGPRASWRSAISG